MMRPDNLRVMGEILSLLRRSQSKTILLVVQGIAWMAQAASIPVAAFVSQATGSQINSALTRFYRLLHNPKLDDLRVARQMLSFFAQLPGPFLITIDWTEWHPPFRMLLASVVRGTRPFRSTLRCSPKPISTDPRTPRRTISFVCSVGS